uniref:Uncharacterized protein n=1 Tax=Escherichia coli TaxID=562 RepID=A0A6G9I0U3_ECOLX|nr:hypothetical protein CBLFMBDD_00145 [Escherichia coli]
MNSLLCRRVKPGFCRLIAVSSNVSPARAFICSETTVKEGWRASFSAVRVSSSEEYSRTSRPLRPDQGGVVHCHLCDGGKNLRTVADGMPGRSTQPFSSFSAMNGESLTGREAGSARPGTTTVIASSLTDAPAGGHRRRRGVREFSLSPQSLAVCHRHFFRPEQRPAAVQGGNTHHLRFILRIPQGQAVLRRHPVDNIAVMTACLRVPLLHHHPGRYISRR